MPVTKIFDIATTLPARAHLAQPGELGGDEVDVAVAQQGRPDGGESSTSANASRKGLKS
jgi:hypothetical protein